MSDAALPNPIPPLDASPEITAMVERLTHSLEADSVRNCHALMGEAAALLRRLGEREARMRAWPDLLTEALSLISLTRYGGLVSAFTGGLDKKLSAFLDKAYAQAKAAGPPAPPAALAAGKEGE